MCRNCTEISKTLFVQVLPRMHPVVFASCTEPFLPFCSCHSQACKEQQPSSMLLSRVPNLHLSHLLSQSLCEVFVEKTCRHEARPSPHPVPSLLRWFCTARAGSGMEATTSSPACQHYLPSSRFAFLCLSRWPTASKLGFALLEVHWALQTAG